MQFLKTVVLALTLVFATTGERMEGLQVGDKAVDFNLKNVDGKMISLKTNKNAKGYILVFTCNTCPYSVMYEDRIIALHKKYAEQGYPVLAIQPNDPQKSPGDSFENMQVRAKEKGFPFPYVMDETQEVTKTYGATNTPHVYVLNKTTGGDFKIEYIGAIDNNSRNAEAASKRYVEEALDNLIGGGDVPITTTKAIGCTIKWGE
ncbi:MULTISPECIES: thioredoxin family protein [Roseivirga]|jgi:peroxiredoxin|uniref:Thioredoxin family protein n=1 Tax=Roseivirga thermotolerans TaxID=1758176 RepID=A0ABQ3I1F0_9BACT|nr:MULTISPECIES: thioredoxin family protein [Roseivirga]MEC7755225.1 thioredoxin family protein [Bacteroidota bacterium]GHE55382.1 thioredoxin family protein [Roseivirga thermotolerans]|tara:strand:+ start:2788 stop:3399 length:612 start_codon:yes stop_codon:yes gene_type:complete